MKWLTKAGKYLFTVCAPIIISALLQGQSLAGLVKLRGLVTIILKGNVPAWAFTATFIVAALGTIYFFEHRTKKTGKLHFVPSPEGCNWGKAADQRQDNRTLTVMFLCLRGTLTNEGESELQLLSFYPKNTRPVSGLRVFQAAADGSGTPIETSVLLLTPQEPTEATIYTFVTPNLGRNLSSYRGQLMCRSHFNREYDLGTVVFQPRFPTGVDS